MIRLQFRNGKLNDLNERFNTVERALTKLQLLGVYFKEL